MAFSSNYRQPMPVNTAYNYSGGMSAPPLPPRNYGQLNSGSYGGTAPNYSGYNNYGFGGAGLSSYGGYGLGGYSGYGSGYGTSGYSGFGFGGGGYGFGGMNSENRFIQLAENSARPAFDSFRSVMGMLQSVTMMFDSTFHAIHASYASVLGVADNFSRLRSMFARAFSAFSVIKALNWLYRRLLRLMGYDNSDPSLTAAWASTVNNGLPGAAQTGSNWPAMGLICLLIAGPYLVMKLVSQIVPETPTEIWNPVENAGTRAEVLFDFQRGTGQELSVNRGQMLMVAPKLYQPSAPGWVLACDQNKRMGLVPANYIQIESTANLKSFTPQNESGAYVPVAPTLANIVPADVMPSQPNNHTNIQGTPLAEKINSPSVSTPSSAASSALTDVTPALTQHAEVNIPPVCPAPSEVISVEN